MANAPQRPRCPFYGFHWPENSHTLTDSGGAECALDFDRCCPCAMEAQGQAPDYDVCPVADRLRPLLEGCKKNVTVCPAETAPDGVPLEQWKKKVMVRRRSAG